MDINNHDGFVCELLSIAMSTSCFHPTIPSFPALAAPAPSPLSKPTRTVASLARHTFFIFFFRAEGRVRGAGKENIKAGFGFGVWEGGLVQIFEKGVGLIQFSGHCGLRFSVFAVVLN